MSKIVCEAIITNGRKVTKKNIQKFIEKHIDEYQWGLMDLSRVLLDYLLWKDFGESGVNASMRIDSWCNSHTNYGYRDKTYYIRNDEKQFVFNWVSK